MAFALVSVSCLWIGCSGSSSSPEVADAGADAEAGVPTDAGGPVDDGSTTKDAAPDAPVDAGPTVDAPEVSIQYGNCANFTACGGDPTGKWTISGGCVREETLAPAKEACPGLTESNVAIKARGLYELTATNVKRQTQVSFSANVSLPAGCKQQAGNSCSVIAFLLKSPPPNGFGFDTAACADANDGGCNCTVGQSKIVTSAGTYTKDATTITASGGETYDYCVANGKFSYEETTANTFLRGYFDLTK